MPEIGKKEIKDVVLKYKVSHDTREIPEQKAAEPLRETRSTYTIRAKLQRHPNKRFECFPYFGSFLSNKYKTPKKCIANMVYKFTCHGCDT